jgi:hypothetical protein
MIRGYKLLYAITIYVGGFALGALIDIIINNLLLTALLIGVYTGMFIKDYRTNWIVSSSSIITLYFGVNLINLSDPYSLKVLEILSSIVGLPSIVLLLLPLIILTLVSTTTAIGVALLRIYSEKME